MDKPLLFTKPKCANCELVKGTLKKFKKLDNVKIMDTADATVLAVAIMDYDVMSFPTLIDVDGQSYTAIAQILDKLGIK